MKAIDSIEMNDKRFILLNDSDNVLICCGYVAAGDSVLLDGKNVTVLDEINIGHKVARRKIEQGEKIIRYGAAIGSAVADIAFGQHVHFHNMKSDYIPGHTREKKMGVEG
ncbi:UxaA family hydrolase [Microbulbifer sp. TYP-18]|uniref:UxaA family hydrolase n=1 Tax=Microbulbifer sp. TYP-18 TaxID=3230024 RepID=UPI0034C66911